MIFLSIRYLIAKRTQTLLTLLGIFLGTTSYIAISGFMLGFRGYLIESLINNNPHIIIESREDFLTEHGLDSEFYGTEYDHVFWFSPPYGRKDNAVIEKPQEWYKRLDTDPRVLAYSPQLTIPAVFGWGASNYSSKLLGCDPVAQVKVTTIGDHMIKGDFKDLSYGGNNIVLGEELRKRIGVDIHQKINVALANQMPVPFNIVGIFQTGSQGIDETAYASLSDVQRVSQSSQQINQIVIRLFDYTKAALMATTWSSMLPEFIQSWDMINANIFSIFRVQDAIRYLSVGSVLVVAGFGIYNVLNMTVMQKRRDIAILKAIGFSQTEIVSIFFSQGVILGVLGSLLGAFFGYLLCLYVQTLPFSGKGPMGVHMDHLIISMSPVIYMQAILLGVVSAVIASIIPATLAGKLTPIQIIREGAD